MCRCRNSTGGANTATGAFALISNTTGDDNTAIGFRAMAANTTGHVNTAVGNGALESNTEGHSNTAVGLGALGSNTTGIKNVALGRFAGTAVLNANNVICIGAEVLGQNVSNNCYIGEIAGVQLDRNNADVVYIDVTTGQLGTVLVDAPGDKTTGPVPRLGQGQALFNQFLKEHRKVEEQGATIAQLKKEVATLAASRKRASHANPESGRPARIEQSCTANSFK